MENKLQEVVNKIDRAKTCIHVEIFVDRRPCVYINGVDASAFINPFALKSWLKATIQRNGRQTQKTIEAIPEATVTEEEQQ